MYRPIAALLAGILAVAVLQPGTEPTAFAQITVKTAKPVPKVNKNLHPRSLDEIKKELTAIMSAPLPKGNDQAIEMEQGLRQLKVYRYLVGVPHANLAIDPQYNQLAQAAAGICEKLGRLDHKPKNPGLPEDQYQLAAKGAASSNLGAGLRNQAHSIDVYMNDSDKINIDRLGHRRWCLNPSLMKVGFGKSGKFYAMYSMDRSQPKTPDFDMICYPTRGYMPVEYFNPRYAWSVTLNPYKVRPPDPKTVKPSIFQADAAGSKTGDALPLDYANVNLVGFGVPNCIIFRPAKLDMTPGQRYLVEVDGLAVPGGRISYLVEFVSLR